MSLTDTVHLEKSLILLTFNKRVILGATFTCLKAGAYRITIRRPNSIARSRTNRNPSHGKCLCLQTASDLEEYY